MPSFILWHPSGFVLCSRYGNLKYKIILIVKYICRMYNRPRHTPSNNSIFWTRWSLYHAEWKSQFAAKSPSTVWHSRSAHVAWVKRLTQATWAERECQTVLGDLAANWDFHSAWYRDHLVQNIELLEGVWRGLLYILHIYFTMRIILYFRLP